MSAPFKAPATVLDELGIAEPADIDIEAIAQYCGATVVYEPLDGCEARILGVGDRAVITVNAKAVRERQRFSAGHELGHWMRDRGRIAFVCTDQVLVREWGDDNPERRANRYAADLLLPRRMFESLARGTPPTFASARALARTFETSLTATAIRLVELGSYPSMMICTDGSGRKWFVRSHLVPSSLWPTATPGTSTIATQLLQGYSNTSGPETVDADEWIDRADASRYAIIEDSLRTSAGVVLTLLWWKDEQQILDLDEGEEGDDREEYRRRY